MVQLLISYANEKIFENKNGDYPLYWACCKNNIEIVQLIVDYANNHKIFLEYNHSNIVGNKRIYDLLSNNWGRGYV
ncbi:hypothetical protein H8356DRAFT_1362094 [Neocallimastix lanati (nom. inval.)]|nr:hypothetical protein H8356DRAFT_1362094 [Neocallimastix sp. JGI-2020a]